MSEFIPKFQPIMPRDGGEEVDYLDALCDGSQPLPLGAMKAQVLLMPPEEFAERLWESSRMDNIREHMMLLEARNIPPEHYEDGTDLFTIWALWNIPCGPNPLLYYESSIKAVVKLLKEIK